MLNKCLECQGDYYSELSREPLSKLSGSGYEPKLLSDARDERFCSKWCEKEWYDKNYTPEDDGGPVNLIIPKTVFSPSAGKHFSSRRKLKAAMKETGVVNTMDLDTPLKAMERDKTMMGMIKNGNASDPGLKREAAEIQRTYEDNRKNKVRENDQRELYKMKKERGLLPEQLYARSQRQ